MAKGRDVKKKYLTQESLNEKRLKALMAIYDSALRACVQQDADGLGLAMDVLQSKLKFEVWPGLGLVLYAQYNRCRELGRAGNYLEAGRVLAELRRAWTSGARRAEAHKRRAEQIARAMRVAESFSASEA